MAAERFTISLDRTDAGCRTAHTAEMSKGTPEASGWAVAECVFAVCPRPAQVLAHAIDALAEIGGPAARPEIAPAEGALVEAARQYLAVRELFDAQVRGNAKEAE